MSPLYLIVFLLAAVISIYYIFFKKSKKDGALTSLKNSNRSFSIENVGPEGKIAISNFGEDHDALNITINGKNRHHEGDNFWYELEGETSNGTPFWLQIESLDPLALNGGNEELDFNRLGLSTADLEQMRIEQKAFKVNDVHFYFETSGEAQVYPSETEDKEDFRWYRYWNFSNEKENVFISVQQFEDMMPEASISYPIQKNQLRIFEVGRNVE